MHSTPAAANVPFHSLAALADNQDSSRAVWRAAVNVQLNFNPIRALFWARRGAGFNGIAQRAACVRRVNVLHNVYKIHDKDAPRNRASKRRC